MPTTATPPTRSALLQQVDAIVLEHDGRPAFCEYAARAIGINAADFTRLASEAGYQITTRGRWENWDHFMKGGIDRASASRRAAPPRTQVDAEMGTDAPRARLRAEAEPAGPPPRVASTEMRERVEAVFRHPLSRGRETSAVLLLSSGMPTKAVLDVLAAYEVETPAEPTPAAAAAGTPPERQGTRIGREAIFDRRRAEMRATAAPKLDVERFLSRTGAERMAASASAEPTARPRLDPGRYMAKTLPAAPRRIASAAEIFERRRAATAKAGGSPTVEEAHDA